MSYGGLATPTAPASTGSGYGGLKTPTTPNAPSTTQNQPNILQQLGGQIKSAFTSSVQQGQQGAEEFTNPQSDTVTGGALEGLQGGAKFEAGIAGTIFSPLAPLTNLIGKAMQFVGDKLSDTPLIKQYAATAPDSDLKVLDALQNLGTVAMGILGAKGGEIKPSEISATDATQLAQHPDVIDATQKVIDAGKERQSTQSKGYVGVPSTEAPTEPLNTATPETPNVLEAPKTIGRTTQTLKPIEGTGELKTRGLSQNIEATAIEKKISDNFGDLPEYRQVSMKDQALKAADLITKDPESAKQIALGNKAPPKGILPESVMVAVEHDATIKGDVQILKDLANSKLAASATTMGQRIRTLGERDMASPLDAIREVQQAREAQVAKRGTSIPQETATRIGESIRKVNTKENWSSFIESIQC